jgi:2'-5' RNA ligase
MAPSLIPDIIACSHQSALWSGIADTPAAPTQEAPGARDAVFFCLYPPSDIAEHSRRLAANLRERHGLSCPLTRVRCLHISLLGFGHHKALSLATIAALRTAAASVTMPPFRVSLNLAMSFRGNPTWPFVLTGDEGVSGIEMFRQELIRALWKAGIKLRAKSDFVPHMTLFYSERDLGTRAVEEMDWTVHGFCLVRSLYGHSRHVPLGQWPLPG